MFRALLALSMLLAGCPGSTQAYVNKDRVSVSSLENGQIRVSGQPGTVTGAKATTLTLTVMRESNRTTAHLGSELPVTSGFASVNADGGFAEVRLGDAQTPVKSGDELNLTPQNGTSVAGPTVSLLVP